MLQRAASNAYSWWWASNIRTKQSKWLDSNLHEMEDKVRSMIKLIEVDADSFAKKAEMYYQRRPELIKFVEETYKAYKALADRYDRMSGELHKANHTLASAFPDQFQFAMQEDEGDGSPRAFTAMDTTKVPKGELPQISLRNKSRDAFAAIKKHHKKASSPITKENVQSEIDRIQKEILSLQTEKEFVKSSYESTLAKFWEIESHVVDLQDEVCALQDEHGASCIIEDDEARALMAATAIKSCEESLITLQHQHKKSGEEAAMESQRISDVKNRLLFLKGESCSHKTEENSNKGFIGKEDEGFDLKKAGLDLHSVCAQVKQHFQMNSDTSVVDLAEKIDELVEKVISLEVTVSSQTAQIQMLRSETGVLQKHLRGLEEDKANLIIDSNGLSVALSQAESELHRVQNLEKLVHREKGIFQTKFLEACHSLNDISEKLQSPNLEESNSGSSNIANLENNKEMKETEEIAMKDDIAEPNAEYTQEQPNSYAFLTPLLNNLPRAKNAEPDNNHNIPDLPQNLSNGLEGRQKILLYEYTSILQNYKDTKIKLTEMEKKNQEYHFEMMAEIQELKSLNAVKDQEIRALRRKLFSHTSSNVAATNQKEIQMLNTEENGHPVDGLAVNLYSPDAEIADADGIKLCHSDQQLAPSSIEEKFRAELDGLLDENLNFWLRFSTSYHHIQKFEASFKDLQSCLDKLKEPKKGSSAPTSPKHSSKQETTPLDKKLKELHSELQVWLEQNALLKGELQCRLTSLTNIQEEISKAGGEAEVDESKFTPYQAAKFHGELLNMQQENNKVAMELQTGWDHVKALQTDVSKALSKVRESFDLSVSNGYTQYQNFRHCSTKSKIPLRIFLFGEKRKKPSIFSCMSPALHRHHNQMKLGFPS